MININELDNFKDAYLDLLKTKKECIDELYLAEDYSISHSIEKDIKNLALTMNLFFNAKKNNDDLAIQAALLRVSTFLSSISGALEQARDDIDLFMKIPNIEDFPDDYKIPEHYNYPLK